MAVVYRCVGTLTVDVIFFRSPGVFHSQDSFPTTFRPRLWETSSGVVAVGVFAAEARRGEGILRMEDTRTSEEDDIDSQGSNTPIEHGHLAN